MASIDPRLLRQIRRQQQLEVENQTLRGEVKGLKEAQINSQGGTPKRSRLRLRLQDPFAGGRGPKISRSKISPVPPWCQGKPLF